MDSSSNQFGTTIAISIPVTRPEIFGHSATADILSVLADNPDTGYGMRELSRAVETTHKTVSDAVDDLAAIDLVKTTHQGPKRIVQINTNRLRKPSDPILSIPQAEFQSPIRELLTGLIETVDGLLGVIIFGSVARGDADRQSDIDCFVLVKENQATAQKTAHELVDELHERQFDGDRYTFQVLVESVETATQYGGRLQDIIVEGITIHDSPEFEDLKQEVLINGR
jgi:predicted nucleotidyltransferase